MRPLLSWALLAPTFRSCVGACENTVASEQQNETPKRKIPLHWMTYSDLCAMIEARSTCSCAGRLAVLANTRNCLCQPVWRTAHRLPKWAVADSCLNASAFSMRGNFSQTAEDLACCPPVAAADRSLTVVKSTKVPKTVNFVHTMYSGSHYGTTSNV